MIEWQSGCFPLSTGDIFCFEDMCFVGGIRRCQHVPCTIFVFDATCPRTFSVCILSVGHIEVVIVTKGLMCIVDGMPAHEVFGSHDWNAWVHVHGGAGHVVGVFYTSDGDVGYVSPDDGVADGMFLSVKIISNQSASCLHLR